MKRLKERIGDYGRRVQGALYVANRGLGGMPLLLKRTLDAYNAHDGVFVSAAMAYYFFFSLFPLILALIALGSLVLDNAQTRRAATLFISQALPILQDAIVSAVDQVLAQRGAIGVLAILGFIYSGSGLFGVLLAVVSRVWGRRCVRSSLVQRLLAAGLVLGLVVFFFIVLFVTTAVESLGPVLARELGLTPAQWQDIFNAGSILVSFVVTAGLLLLLYWKLPGVPVHFADAWPAAVAAGLAWVAARSFFAWYLAMFTHFTLVYGSFATIIGFLTWLYLTGYIIQLGAELSAQIAERRGRGPTACATRGP